MFSSLTKTQIVSLLMMFSAIGTQICGLDHWRDMFHPSFIGGTIGLVTANLMSLFSDNPTKKDGE